MDAADTITASPRARLGLPEPAGKLLLGALLLGLHTPTLRWLARILTDTHFRLSAYLLLAVVALVVMRVRKARITIDPRAPAHAEHGPVTLLIASEILFLLNARWLDANIVAAVLLGVSLYAVAGLYVSPATWRRGLPGLLVFLAVLPFGEALQIYAGMPARHLTARVVEHTLALARVAFIPAETVLVLESGLVYVGAPCSGIRSLWTGLVFFTGATWIERVPLGWAWAVRGVVFAVLLVLANIVRVLVIVLVGPVAGARQVAEIIHEPLGVLGFIMSCGAAYLMLRRLRAPEATLARTAAPSSRITLALVALTLVAALVHQPRPRRPPTVTPRFTLIGEPIPLTHAEAGLFARVGRTTATKRRFEWRGHVGSLLAIHSTSWRAHHAPEICLAGAGHSVDDLQTWSTGPADELRVASLDHGANTALYWYQSRTRTTAELLTRVFSDLRGDEDEWVMVSILVEGRWPVGDPRTLALYDFIRASVADALSERGPR